MPNVFANIRHKFDLLYSVRNATTGSLLAAILAGTRPAIEVNAILKSIIKSPCKGLSAHMPVIVGSKCVIIKLIGILKMYVTNTPISPAVKPMMTVSALNMLDTSLLRAPKDLKIPISFVRSTTDT